MVGGGGKGKHITGSFTSVNNGSGTSTQNSFNVSGVTFDPKMICIKRTSYVNVENTPELVSTAWWDFENSVGSVSSASNGGNGFVWNNSVMTATRSGSVLTVAINNCSFAGDMYEGGYGTYQYHIYG